MGLVVRSISWVLENISDWGTHWQKAPLYVFLLYLVTWRKSLYALGCDFQTHFPIDYYVELVGVGFDWIHVLLMHAGAKPCPSLSNNYLLPTSDPDQNIVFYDVCVLDLRFWDRSPCFYVSLFLVSWIRHGDVPPISLLNALCVCVLLKGLEISFLCLHLYQIWNMHLISAIC